MVNAKCTVKAIYFFDFTDVEGYQARSYFSYSRFALFNAKNKIILIVEIIGMKLGKMVSILQN